MLSGLYIAATLLSMAKALLMARVFSFPSGGTLGLVRPTPILTSTSFGAQSVGTS